MSKPPRSNDSKMDCVSYWLTLQPSVVKAAFGMVEAYRNLPHFASVSLQHGASHPVRYLTRRVYHPSGQAGARVARKGAPSAGGAAKIFRTWARQVALLCEHGDVCAMRKTPVPDALWDLCGSVQGARRSRAGTLHHEQPVPKRIRGRHRKTVRGH